MMDMAMKTLATFTTGETSAVVRRRDKSVDV